MRLATVSDLHVDHPANRALLPALVSAVEGADVVVVAGDVSHVDAHIEATLRSFKLAVSEVVFLPGNHELFQPRGTPDAWPRYREQLAQVAQAAGAHYLPAEPFVADGVAICGTCGWYDYSFLLPSIRALLPRGAVEQKSWEGMVWADVRYVRFRDRGGAPMGDVEVARQMESDLEAQLRWAEEACDVRAVLAVTHHLAFSEAVFRTHTLPWEFFNAYMGSRELGRVISRNSKVRAAVYGHTHHPGRAVVEGFEVVGTPLGYPRERKRMSEADVVATRVNWLQV